MKIAGVLFVVLVGAAALAVVWLGWKIGVTLLILSVLALMVGAVLDPRMPKP